MSSSAFRKVSSLLLSLSSSELEQIASSIRLLQKNKGLVDLAMAAEDDMDRLDLLLYKEIHSYLSKMTGADYMALGVMKKVQRERFMQVVYLRERLDKHINDWSIEVKRQKTRQLFYRLYCRTVGSHIVENTRQELSLKTLLQFTEDFPAILDRDFPSYARSGMLPLVLDRL